eukprot:g2138.t1
MSLQCAECSCNIVDSEAGGNLSFCVDGTSLHLVMGASNEGRAGIGFRVVDVPAGKGPNEENPYRSVAHVLCGNIRQRTGQECRKKVGGVKCYPPLSDNRLIFFTHKALLVDLVRHKSWKTARDSSLRNVSHLPAAKEEQGRRFTPRRWPPLIRSNGAPSLHPVGTTAKKTSGLTSAASPIIDPAGGRRQSGGGGGGGGGGGRGHSRIIAEGAGAQTLTRSTPRGYQEELFSAVMGSERNSMVYLPTGLGKTLVACMVLRRLLDLNPGRQAYFLVETTALAMQQTTQLQNELRGRVEMLVGSSLQAHGNGGIDHGSAKLERVRAADVVVATAGAFEHCMCKHYVDPDAICCVVLDEAHHCGKEHPFNRVARSFLTIKAFPDELANPGRASELPKLVALTASPAGELTLYNTVVRIEQLLDRLGADLAAPVQHLQEVKRLTPPVRLELMNVTATGPETALLGSLERLVLSRVARVAPEASEVRAQAQSLLSSLDGRLNDAAATAATIGADVPRKDDSWRFPSKFFEALCQRAVAAAVSGGEGSAEGLGERGLGVGCDGREADGGVASSSEFESGEDGHGTDSTNRDVGGCDDGHDPYRLHHLMNVAFAVDEMGGRAAWEAVLEELERGRPGPGGDLDLELEVAIQMVKHYLPGVETSPPDLSEDGSGEPEAAAGAITTSTTATANWHNESSTSTTSSGRISGRSSSSGSRAVGGSKLAKIAILLEQHKRECDESGKRFSALVFVSRRDLALAAPAMLEAAARPAGFVRAQAVVGLSEMTLNQQRVALGAFREGAKNVLVSTSVCGEGIDVPACALVVCASLPSSGTDLVQLRGRIRSKEKGCRFLGLTRNAGAADQAHLESICLREKHMLEAVRCLSLGRSGTPLLPESASAAAPVVPPASKGDGEVASFSFAETAIAPAAPACASSDLSKANKAASGGAAVGSKRSSRVVPGGVAARGKAVFFDSNGNGSGIPVSPTSDATADTYFSSEAPSSVAALSIGSVPEGAATSGAEEGGGALGWGSRSPRAASVSPGGGGGGGGGSPTLEISSLPLSDAEAAAAAAAAAAAGLEATTLTESTAEATPPRVTGARSSPSPTVHASPSSEVTLVANPAVAARTPVEREVNGVVSSAERRQAGMAVRCGGDGAARAGYGGVVEASPWTKDLPEQLSSAARRYAATYLATCVRQALQRNPDQMARCTLNSAAQLAQTIKPVFTYDERKIKRPDGFAFEARCIVSSLLKELSGLIVVKEAKGSSIKAAREGAAVKVKMFLLSKEVSKLQQPPGSV